MCVFFYQDISFLKSKVLCFLKILFLVVKSTVERYTKNPRIFQRRVDLLRSSSQAAEPHAVAPEERMARSWGRVVGGMLYPPHVLFQRKIVD